MTERHGYRPPPAVPVVHRADAIVAPPAPPRAEQPPASGGNGVVLLAISLGFAVIIAVAFVAQITSQLGRPTYVERPPVVEVEPPDPPLSDPGIGLPPPTISTTMTRTQVEGEIQHLIRSTFQAGGIDDPEIPDDLVYPLSYAPCDATSVRGQVEVWFASRDRDAALELVRSYWDFLGYTTAEGPDTVAAAGREPLLAETLRLDRVSWDDDLRLSLTTPCVLDQ